MSFAEFIAPVAEAEFRADYFGKRPLHIAANSAAEKHRGTFDWCDLARLLDITEQWADGKLRLIMDSKPVATEHYTLARETGRGITVGPSPTLVEAMMGLGASLVADSLEDADGTLRRVSAMLGRAFAAKAGVNLYASVAGVQAFASHCDPHEVFVVQCCGTKRWRIYANRAESPVGGLLSTDQAAIDQAKGAVLMQPELRPGDLLYIPRGFYHDAVASSQRSLHLTFAVQPLYGIAALDLLRDLALEHGLFREYLAPADDHEALSGQLTKLAEAAARLLVSPALREDLAVRQRTLAPRVAAIRLDRTEPSQVWRRTPVAMRIEQPESGSRLIVGDHGSPIGLLSDAARWIAGQQAFTEAQLRARFPHHPWSELEALLARLERERAIAPFST